MILNLLLASCDGDSNSLNSSSENPSGSSSRESLCPDNFVLIPALEDYTANDFCVMKYEAKNDGSGNAISQASGTPYVNINQQDSVAKCVAMGAGYDLITNNEWQSIARNIEGVSSNWGTIPGEGTSLNQGHSDNDPQRVLVASSDDSKACENTGQTCDSTTWDRQRRTHILSNGEVIWDLAGNANEWIKSTTQIHYSNNGPYILQLNDQQHGSLDLNGDIRTGREHFGVSRDYTGINLSLWGGFGGARLTSGGEDSFSGINRGGDYLQGVAVAGIFAVSLSVQKNEHYSQTGFRCVYHL